jgi:hypothetical protein
VHYQLTVGQETQDFNTYNLAASYALGLGGQMCETSGWALLGSAAATWDAAFKTAAEKWSP